PLETGQMPWIRFGVFSVTHGPDKIERGYQHPETENRCARGRKHIEHLKLRWIRVITSRHTEIPGHKLRQECQVEPDKDHERAESAPAFGVHAPADLGPPVVKTTEVSHQSSADHDVVEVSNDEVCVTQMHVHAERCQEQSGHAADREQADKAERVEHWCVIR